MASYFYTIIRDLSDRTKSKAISMAKDKGFEDEEIEKLYSKRNSAGKVVDVIQNFSPF